MFQLFLILILASCNTTNRIESDSFENKMEEIYDSLCKDRSTNNCIIGRYVGETSPVRYFLTITDSMVFLKTSNHYFKECNYDTTEVSVTCKQRKIFIKNEIKIKDFSLTKEMDSYSKIELDTSYYSSGFLLLTIDKNYILLYKVRDHYGNDIELPQFDRDFYFSWLLVSGVERRIIEHYFGYPYSELTKFSIKVYE